MARQVYSAPSATVTNGDFSFQPPNTPFVRVNRALMANGAEAYLSVVNLLQDRGIVQIRLSGFPGGEGTSAGPDFTDTMEASGTITLVSGSQTLVLTGIGDSDNAEPYSWIPSDPDRVHAFRNAYVSGTKVTVTFDDGVSGPYVQILSFDQATFGGGRVSLKSFVSDPDFTESQLTAAWTGSGTFEDSEDQPDTTFWTAPAATLEAQEYVLTLNVTNPNGVSASDTITITVREAGLLLSDMPQSGLEFDALALLQAGTFPSNVFSRPPRAVEGSLIDGELEIGSTDEPITRLRILDNGERFVINDSGPLSLSTYFGVGGDGHDLTVYVRTGTGDAVASWTVADNRRSAAGQNIQFNVPESERSILTGIALGERWIFALARGAAAPQERVRAEVQSGVPVVSARVRATTAVRVQAAIRSGVPAVSARVRSRPSGDTDQGVHRVRCPVRLCDGA